MLIHQIKFFFKTLKSSLLMNILYFTAIPLFMGGFMGFIDTSSTPKELEPSPIVIEDNDNTTSSKLLNQFINDNLNDFFDIVKSEEDADIKLIIPNNYEDDLVNDKVTNVSLEELDSERTNISTLKNILDSYHTNLYINKFSSDIDNNILEVLNSSAISEDYITPNKTENSYEKYSLIMISFLSMTMICVNLQAKFTPLCIGLEKRMHSLPHSRIKLFLFDVMESFIHYFIFNMIYTLTYRLLNVSFTGNIFELILIGFFSSLLVASISGFINCFSSKFFSYSVVIILNIYQIGSLALGTVSGDLASSLFEFLRSTSPIYLIDNMYTNFVNSSSYTSEIFTVTIVSLTLLSISMIKEKYLWRKS